MINIAAQQADNILTIPVTIEARELPVTDVLNNISQQTGIGFVYSDDIISMPKKVTIQARNKSLETVLNQLLVGKNIEYKVSGKQIIFQRKKITAKHTISGYLKDFISDERMIFASVYDSLNQVGTNTNAYGFYSLTIPEGKVSLDFSYIGYYKQRRTFSLNKDTLLNIDLKPNTQLKEVIVTYNQNKVDNTKMGVEPVSVKDIKALPNVLGESDVIRTIQLLPGVQGKEFSNFYVRGGYHDQNLVLLDDATIYKPSHIGGIYSVFNTDAIKNVELYKGVSPPSYGGRLSSVLDVRMREGNAQQFNSSGSLGLLFSHLNLEGPIIKNKMSFIASARRSYFDIFFPLAKNPSSRKNKAYFLDFNVKLNYIISQRDRLYISTFNSNDVISLNNDGDNQSEIFYRNQTFSLRHNHVFNMKLFANTVFTYTNFRYGSNSYESDELENTSSTTSWKGRLTDWGFKQDYTWYANPANTLNFGVALTLHHVQVGSSFESEGNSTQSPLPKINSTENALYAGMISSLSPSMSLEYGIRLSMHSNVGPSFYYKYVRGEFGQLKLTDTVSFKKGEFYNTHVFLEPRLSLSYKLNAISSVKLGYSRNTQNIHLLTNMTFSTPFDIWYPTTTKVKPQHSDIVTTGYYLELVDYKFSLSTELYYKWTHHIIDFKDHAQLLGNPFFEDELEFGNSKSYGAEFNIRKNTGRLTGWAAYTWSRAFITIDEINNGKPYPATYDVPHDISIGVVYKAGKRITLSANWVYATGAATKLFAGTYHYLNIEVPYYKGKNAGRLPDYHRLDVSMTLLTRKTLKRQAEGKPFNASWNFSVYNLYNRANPVSMTIQPSYDDELKGVAKKLYLFGFMPSVSYTFKF